MNFKALLVFLRRSFMPLVLLALVSSVGANVLLIKLESQGKTTEPRSSSTPDSKILPATAFGKVNAGFVRRIQAPVLSGGNLSPVSGYTVPPDILPKLSGSYPLYRDPGTEIDQAVLSVIFTKLNLPEALNRKSLVAQNLELRTPDGKFGLTLKLQDRILSVRSLQSPADPGTLSELADEASATRIARDFAAGFGIDASGFSIPHTEAPLSDPDGNRWVIVWPMMFSGSQVVDVNGQRVHLLRVGVNRQAALADSLTFNLLSPAALLKSDYPAASINTIVSSLQSGGILPLGGDLAGKPAEARYDKASVIFVLRPANENEPAYLVPAIKAEWEAVSECAACQKLRLSTFVPLISPEFFTWYQRPAAPAPAISSPSPAQK
ncbi:hypothetical protein A3A67_03930 [Candidatus Peribacteria bacterium RIFCSPLOWO2_01_FULL_51_18]|nr:MAG: hypothetical protein A3A67_03930 [Candidatus Peribacteria bacterium RIFCSPLOWO2_01_FULL_51_18]